MRSLAPDLGNAEAIRQFAARVETEFPALNAVIHNAGIMQDEALVEGGLDAAEATVAINLLGPSRLNAALMPLLLG